MKVCPRGIEWGASLFGMSVSEHFSSLHSLHFVSIHCSSNTISFAFWVHQGSGYKGKWSQLGQRPWIFSLSNPPMPRKWLLLHVSWIERPLLLLDYSQESLHVSGKGEGSWKEHVAPVSFGSLSGLLYFLSILCLESPVSASQGCFCSSIFWYSCSFSEPNCKDKTRVCFKGNK